MQNKLTLRYFKIKRCGYWSSSSKKPNHFENLPQTLTSLEEYVKDKTIEETGIARGNKDPKTFVLDVKYKNGLWVLALWNLAAEGASDEIVSLDLKSKLGKVDSAPVSAGQGKSFGFVSYFLIWPEHSFYATILPPGATLAGRAEFDEYMLNFLWIDPNFVEKVLGEEMSEDGSTREIERQGFKFPIPINGKPIPQFSALLAKSPSEKDYVVENYDKVVKVHNRCTVKVTPQQSAHGLLGRLVPSLFGRTELFAPLSTIRMNHSISAAFSKKADLEAWIREWEQHAGDLDKDDCGFKLEGDDKIYWIRGNIIKCELAAGNLHRVNGIYPAEKILDLVEQRRDLVLADFQLSNDT